MTAERNNETTNLDLARVSGSVSKGHEHDSGDINDLAVDL